MDLWLQAATATSSADELEARTARAILLLVFRSLLLAISRKAPPPPAGKPSTPEQLSPPLPPPSNPAALPTSDAPACSTNPFDSDPPAERPAAACTAHSAVSPRQSGAAERALSPLLMDVVRMLSLLPGEGARQLFATDSSLLPSLADPSSLWSTCLSDARYLLSSLTPMLCSSKEVAQQALLDEMTSRQGSCARLLQRELAAVREEEREGWVRVSGVSNAVGEAMAESEGVRWSEAVSAGEEMLRLSERRWRKVLLHLRCGRGVWGIEGVEEDRFSKVDKTEDSSRRRRRMRHNLRFDSHGERVVHHLIHTGPLVYRKSTLIVLPIQAFISLMRSLPTSTHLLLSPHPLTRLPHTSYAPHKPSITFPTRTHVYSRTFRPCLPRHLSSLLVFTSLLPPLFFSPHVVTRLPTPCSPHLMSSHFSSPTSHTLHCTLAFRRR